MVMTAGVHVGSATSFFSLDGVAASRASRGNQMTTGSASLTIFGSHVGLLAFTSRGFSGSSDCEASEWISSTSLRCMTSHGTGGSRRLSITAGEGRSGSSTYVLSYNGPSLDFVKIPGNRPRTGSASVTVRGAFFGLVDVTNTIRVIASTCEVTEWNSDSSLRCLAGQGSGGSHKVLVILHELQRSSPPDGW